MGELEFGLERGFGISGEADAGRDAEDVRIYGHDEFVEYHRTDDICRFAAHARETLHCFDVVGDRTAEQENA